MELKDITKCKVCKSGDIKHLKNMIKCKSCNTKMGITDNKIWYEYSVKNEIDEQI